MQTPDDFVRQQSATTGLPEHLCRMNMGKLEYVLTHLDDVLRSLTRRLDYDILTRGYGEEDGVMRSYQATTPVLGMVLPSNSPGVHSLWLPIIPLQIGLVLKPGPQEPWTPWRMAQAFFQAGVPREAIALYPGLGEVGAAVLNNSPRSLIFGGTATVEQYAANPGVQVHGPGFSKILIGDDVVDDWERYLDLMVESVAINSGRGCINCSGIWASRHTREIAEAVAERIGPMAPLPPDDPKAELAAFTVPGQAPAISADIDNALKEDGVEEVSARHQDGGRLVSMERCDYLRPTVVHCGSPDVGDGQEGVHVPLRHRRGVPAGQDDPGDRDDPRGDRPDRGPGLLAGPARRPQHRPAQPRPRAHDPAQLAAAARGEHRGLPVPSPGVPAGVVARLAGRWSARPWRSQCSKSPASRSRIRRRGAPSTSSPGSISR